MIKVTAEMSREGEPSPPKTEPPLGREIPLFHSSDDRQDKIRAKYFLYPCVRNNAEQVSRK